MKISTKFLIIVLLFITSGSLTFAGSINTEKKVDENAVASLLMGLRSNNPGLQTSCAYLLGELRLTNTVIPLMRVLRNNENETVRIAAALALYKIGTPLSINAVKQAIRFDGSERVRQLAAKFYNEYLRNELLKQTEPDSLYAIDE